MEVADAITGCQVQECGLAGSRLGLFVCRGFSIIIRRLGLTTRNWSEPSGLVQFLNEEIRKTYLGDKEIDLTLMIDALNLYRDTKSLSSPFPFSFHY